MINVTMPQAARCFGLRVEHIGFAARLGRLPRPIGRNAQGLLLFDADQVAKYLALPIEYDLPDGGADDAEDFDDDLEQQWPFPDFCWCAYSPRGCVSWRHEATLAACKPERGTE